MGHHLDAVLLDTVLTCRRRGLYWELRLGSGTVLPQDCRGMAYLAELIANPGYEIPAADLAAGPVLAPRAGAAQPVLDQAAREAYRRRLLELDAAIDEGDARNDRARAERARDERAWLIEELAAATGLAGRPRRFADEAERARISVGKAIRRAIARIAAMDETIGGHLHHTVRTGLRCTYLPAAVPGPGRGHALT
jgi:hypothetical protein